MDEQEQSNAKDSLDYDLTEWLLHHKDGLQDAINTQYSPSQSPLPYSILQEIYENGAMSIIKESMANSLSLDPETLLTRVTPQFVRTVAADLLSPAVKETKCQE